MDDLADTLSLDAWIGGILGLCHIEWKLGLQTAPGTQTKGSEALVRQQCLERFEEYLDLAISIEARKHGGQILQGKYDFWRLLWQQDEHPELNNSIEGQNS